jgi:hypothetical protein
MRSQEFLSESAETHIAAPAQVDRQTMQQLAQLIATGTEVDMAMVARNLQNAASIAWAEDHGQAVGVIVLKRPVTSYRDKVFAAAGAAELAREYNVELGYTYVDPAQRTQGTSIRLMRTMMRGLSGKVFATTRENNTTINKLLTFAGFKQLGTPYTSERGNYKLFLWVNQ